MKVSLFCNTRYLGPSPPGVWPVPAHEYASEVAERSMQESVDRAQLADEIGFDWVTVAEHHYAPLSITPNPMVMAGALTQVVKRAKIALLGPNIPILNPVRVAEEFAMLDTLTGGRVIAGMMRATPNEYVTYNINPDESRGRFTEALELIKMAWSQTRPFGWQGKYFNYRSICIWPRIVQQPHPPIFMSGSSPESGKYAAENRIGLGFAVTTVPLAAKAAAYYREQAKLAGWEPAPDDIIYRCRMHVADTDDEAFEDVMSQEGGRRGTGGPMANRVIWDSVMNSGYRGGDADDERERKASTYDLADRIKLGSVIVGSADTVIEQIRHIRNEIGAGILDLTAAAELGDKTRKSIEMFGEQVLPRIRNM